ncbi:hypothetical protein [uncultured Litoreibacter sp.]|uniref:hypothetical protein n=1 Tax=uncultured Litoreibacter sp. TaxID=1392394 RepID=UPI002627E82E|nr:hypothetical protein [uncultured Litoreibacter sp.]
MKLTRLNTADNSWQDFQTQWKEEYSTYEDEFEGYASAALGTLENECDNGTPDPDSGVFALIDDQDRIHAACFLNSTLLKGFKGKVMRVRHLILSPYYDFENLELEQYAEILAHCFTAIVDCSETTLVSPHIKIHYRSPYDRTFFAAFGLTMRSTGRFSTVESKGMWLHLTKT